MTPDILREGKTKIILATQNPYEVLIKSKDAITAGDGVKRDVLEGKAAFATQTTSNCFRLLNAVGIPTHFLEQVDDVTFRARNARMIPTEVVTRRIATGSYLKRNPEVAEGTYFNPPVVEFFDKDDPKHDPFLIYDFVGGRVLTYNPKESLSTGFMEESTMDNPMQLLSQTLRMVSQAKKIFRILEKAWAKQNVTLVDLKVEFGVDREARKLILADVIDNDSWRIWPGGDKTKMLDKQIFRDTGFVTPVQIKNYSLVAEMTNKFVK